MGDIFYHEEYEMWWPKFDHNPKGNKHTIENGIGAIEVLRKHCKGFDLCVQAGGHLGYWPLELSKYFNSVYTFEADPIVYHCLKINTQGAPNISSYNLALSDNEGIAKIRRGASAGGSRIAEDGKILMEQCKIDDRFSSIDAIVLDIEGGEINALKGAQEKIKRHSPVILVEELPEYKEELQAYLESINYKRVDEYAKDGIWVRK